MPVAHIKKAKERKMEEAIFEEMRTDDDDDGDDDKTAMGTRKTTSQWRVVKENRNKLLFSTSYLSSRKADPRFI